VGKETYGGTVDEDFDLDELHDATSKLPNSKAPGEGRAATERMKELLPLRREDGSLSSTSRMATVILRFLNQTRRTGYTPSQRRRATVVSVHKKGGPADTDSYRGVSLTPAPFKLLLTVVTTRVQKAVEENGLFCGEQAGLRAQEECPGQVATLIEVVQRRASTGVPTYLVFVDLPKAYGTVPHEALFGKVYQLGAGGRVLEFVKALHASSTVAVQVGGYTPGPFPLLRGRRQGCPFSCVT